MNQQVGEGKGWFMDIKMVMAKEDPRPFDAADQECHV
jgi:hypothetical protein